MNVDAVQARYDHISAGWRRSSPQRREALLGELGLLALQLPAVRPADPDREQVVAVRAAILELITEIRIGIGHPR